MWRSLSRGARRLIRHPGITIIAFLSLAFGLAAAITMFSIVEALILRPVGVREPESLVLVARTDKSQGVLPVPERMVDILRQDRVFKEICTLTTSYAPVEIDRRVISATTHAMSGGCFQMLGVRAALGRLFGPSDDRRGAARVALLSWDTWQRDFNGSPDVLDARLTLNGEHVSIVGVLERRFRGLVVGFPPNLVIPIKQDAAASSPSAAYWGYAFTRQSSSSPLSVMQARLEGTWTQLLAASVPPHYTVEQSSDYLSSRPLITTATTGLDYVLRDRFGRPAVMLLGLAVVVFLVACVNVIGLLTVRVAERQRDLAVQLSLGAEQRDLLRDTLAEGVLLVIPSALVGVLGAQWACRALASSLELIYEDSSVGLSLNATVVIFTFGVTLVALVAASLLPLWRVVSATAISALSSSHRVTRNSSAIQKASVLTQVALALILVGLGAMLARELHRLEQADLGYPADRVLSVQLSPIPSVSASAVGLGTTYYRTLLERLALTPGVDAVAMSLFAPLFSPPLEQSISSADDPNVQSASEVHVVSEDFFDVMGIPLTAGERFKRVDEVPDVYSGIVSESLSRALFGDGHAVGRRVYLRGLLPEQQVEIVGVSRDATLTQPQAPNERVVYVNFWESPAFQPSSVLLVRTNQEPMRLVRAVERELERHGHEYPSYFRPLTEQHQHALAQEHLSAWLSGAYALGGLCLAVVGVFGLLDYFVVRRARELAIRIALGALPWQINVMVLREGMLLVVVGLAIGFPLAWAAIRLASGWLLADSSNVLPLAFAAVSLIAAAAAGSLVPAWRASSIDPARTLRHE